MDSLSAMSATMSVPRTRNKEKPFFCSLNEANQLAKFLPTGGYRNIITTVTGSYRQSGSTRCLPKQGIISAQLSQITGNVKQKNGKENTIIRLNRTMERKIVITHNY